MSAIKIENLSFSYYGYSKPIFDKVNFNFDTNWKIGLIGRNGIGKTTLFRLLLGKEEYIGNIHSSVKFMNFPPDNIDEDKLGIEIFEEFSNNEEEWKLFKELNLLRLDIDVIYRKFKTLSKGEQTKLLLAILFTIDRGFLLIDEPTNHLDIDGRRKVAEYLKSKSGFLLISHDRKFLDECIDYVISINKNSIDVESGNFSSWYQNKQRKDKFEIDKNEKLKKDIRRLKEAARQSKLWSDKVEKTKNGLRVSGIKPDKGAIGHKAAKMMKRSKNLENRQNKAVEEKVRLLKDIDSKEELILRKLIFHKNIFMKANNLSCSYMNKKVFDSLNFEIKQGDRIALQGKNGCGKSTLIKLIMGEDIDHTGEVNIANNLKISYIRQDISNLQGSLNKYIRSQDIDQTLCKTILAKLGFSKELFDLDISSYSDGQKKKVLIASSLSKQANLYIWDEPLNYIDVISRIQIEEIILKTEPTLIFVEHDEKFIENIATKKIFL